MVQILRKRPFLFFLLLAAFVVLFSDWARDYAQTLIQANQIENSVIFRTCDIAVGDTSGSAITNAQLGPQIGVCLIPGTATVLEIQVLSDGGTPNVIVGRDRLGTVANLLSGALATGGAGIANLACSRASSSTSFNGTTSCTNTLQNTSLNPGDFVELVSGTAGGTAKFMAIHILYRMN